jgi:hypothetical protein
MARRHDNPPEKWHKEDNAVSWSLSLDYHCIFLLNGDQDLLDPVLN